MPAPVRSPVGIRQLEVLNPHHEDDVIPVVHVILTAYAGGHLDLSTPDGAYYGGMETLRAC